MFMSYFCPRTSFIVHYVYVLSTKMRTFILKIQKFLFGFHLYSRPSLFNRLDHFSYLAVFDSIALLKLRNHDMLFSGFIIRSCQAWMAKSSNYGQCSLFLSKVLSAFKKTLRFYFDCKIFFSSQFGKDTFIYRT